jgi:hypothetical protein
MTKEFFPSLPLCRCSRECMIKCYEWSDGQLGCAFNQVSTVQKSRRTGEFVWYSDFLSECSKTGEKESAEHYSFRELQQAYDHLCRKENIYGRCMVTLLLEIVHAFNDEYNRSMDVEKNIPLNDYEFFVRCILELQERGRKMLPSSLKAELYREAGMFEKCLEFSSADCRSRDEKEIVDEVLFRAAHADTKPFIIEQCEYYSTNLRLAKRFPCPNVGIGKVKSESCE